MCPELPISFSYLVRCYTRDWIVILMDVDFILRVLPSMVFRIWAITERQLEQGALQIQFLETFQFKSFAQLEILWAQKFKRDNILQLTEKTENFTSLCTNFKGTKKHNQTDKDIQIQGDFFQMYPSYSYTAMNSFFSLPVVKSIKIHK